MAFARVAALWSPNEAAITAYRGVTRDLDADSGGTGNLTIKGTSRRFQPREPEFVSAKKVERLQRACLTSEDFLQKTCSTKGGKP